MSSPQHKSITSHYVYLAILLVLFLTLYHSTLLSLHYKWIEWDGPYAHSYIIIGAITYFIFERRHELSANNWQPCLLALPCLLIFVGFWGLGHLSLVLSIEQLSLPFIVFFISLALIGVNTMRLLVPCFLLLLLTLPLWDILIPFLRAVTVIINTQLLSLISLPVNIEEYYITIPAGVFHVASGCSGLSHLMTMLTTASLFAIELRTNKIATLKLFVLAIIFGMLSNWVRVFGLIILGHISDMQNPVIKDHGYYGLIINGIFISIYCFFCMKYVLHKEPTNAKSIAKSTEQKHRPLIATLFIAVLISLPYLTQQYLNIGRKTLDIQSFSQQANHYEWKELTTSKETWKFGLKQSDFSKIYYWNNGINQSEVHISGYSKPDQIKKISPHTFQFKPKDWQYDTNKGEGVIVDKASHYALLKHYIFINDEIYPWGTEVKSKIIESIFSGKQGMAIISSTQSCQSQCQAELTYLNSDSIKIKNFAKSQLSYHMSQ